MAEFSNRRSPSTLGSEPGSALKPVELIELISMVTECARSVRTGRETPWVLESLGAAAAFRMHVRQSAEDLLDLDGVNARLCAGIFLENIRSAARTLGWQVSWKVHRERLAVWEIDVSLERRLDQRGALPGDLGPVPEAPRMRRGLDRCELGVRERAYLESAVGGVFDLQWCDSWSAKFNLARVASLCRSVKASLGAGPAHSEPLASTEGTSSRFVNPTHTHFFLAWKQPQWDSTEALLRAGCALQRLWCAASELDLDVCPWTDPITLRRYRAHAVAFAADSRVVRKVDRMCGILSAVLSEAASESVLFAGHIGRRVTAAVPAGRSGRVVSSSPKSPRPSYSSGVFRTP